MSETESLARRMAADRAERLAARRKVIIAWWVAGVLLLAFIIGSRQAYHWAKSRRAAQFAEAGDQLSAADKPEEAAAKFRAALQLDPMGYRPLQGAARLASKLGRPEASDLWGEVVKLSEATLQDRQAYVESLTATGRFKIAEPILTALLKGDPDTRTLLMASNYSRNTGDFAKAVEFARVAVKRAPTDDSARAALANLLAASTDAAEREEARKILWELTAKEGTVREQALQVLAVAPELSADERARILQMFDANPSLGIKDSLLASDLRLQLHPEDADKIFDQTVARWNNSEAPDLNQLALWLNLRGRHERVLSLFSEDRALADNQLLLSRLDALASLQRWNDVETLLNHPNLTLDPSVLESFRARAAQEKNATMDAEMHWSHAISLAANDAGKLRFVAGFAEKSHADGVALKAYEQLAKIPQFAVGAYRATQRLSARAGDTRVQRSAAEKIAALTPDDPNAADHLVYLKLLAGAEVVDNFEKAKSLAEKFPDRLSFRVTAALGYLRQHDPGMALAQFKGPPGAPPIDWQRTPPAWRAVYAAALLANEQAAAAAEIIKTIPRDRLTPDEQKLIEPLQ